MNLAVFQSIGVTELLIVLGVVLLIFGPKRLPALGRQLGGALREFRDSIRRRDDDDDVPGLSAGPAAPVEEKSALDGEIVRERT